MIKIIYFFLQARLEWGIEYPLAYLGTRSRQRARTGERSAGSREQEGARQREQAEQLRVDGEGVVTEKADAGQEERKARRLLLRPDGTFAGTIGGGCGEAEVWQEAMETMSDGKPRIVTVDLTEPVDGDDKICGGVMEVFIERVVS